MPNTQYFSRDAGFYFTPSSGTTWQTYALPTQLLEPRPAYRIRQYVAESLDFSAREVFNVVGPNSTGHYEFVGTIRFADDSTHTIQFLKSAALGGHLRYTTDLTTGTTDSLMGSGVDVVMIEPGPELVDTLMDRDLGSLSKETLEVTIRLRRATTASPAVVMSSGDFSTASGASWF